jgi:hypothetical protein
MFSQQLAQELADMNVTINALCPGFNITNIGRELWFAGILAPILNFLRVADPHRGAGIIVYSTVNPMLVGNGYYSVACAPLNPVAPGEDMELQKKLWGLMEEMLEQWLVSE